MSPSTSMVCWATARVAPTSCPTKLRCLKTGRRIARSTTYSATPRTCVASLSRVAVLRRSQTLIHIRSFSSPTCKLTRVSSKKYRKPTRSTKHRISQIESKPEGTLGRSLKTTWSLLTRKTWRWRLMSKKSLMRRQDIQMV